MRNCMHFIIFQHIELLKPKFRPPPHTLCYQKRQCKFALFKERSTVLNRKRRIHNPFRIIGRPTDVTGEKERNPYLTKKDRTKTKIERKFVSIGQMDDNDSFSSSLPSPQTPSRTFFSLLGQCKCKRIFSFALFFIPLSGKKGKKKESNCNEDGRKKVFP